MIELKKKEWTPKVAHHSWLSVIKIAELVSKRSPYLLFIDYFLTSLFFFFLLFIDYICYSFLLIYAVCTYLTIISIFMEFICFFLHRITTLHNSSYYSRKQSFINMWEVVSYWNWTQLIYLFLSIILLIKLINIKNTFIVKLTIYK